MTMENEVKKGSDPTDETDKIYRQNLKAELEELAGKFKIVSEVISESHKKILGMFIPWATAMKSDVEADLWEKISQARILRIAALNLHAKIFNRIEVLRMEADERFAADALNSVADGKVTIQ